MSYISSSSPADREFREWRRVVAAQSCVRQCSLHCECEEQPSPDRDGAETSQLPPGGASSTRC